jgi:hypothetical protein
MKAHTIRSRTLNLPAPATAEHLLKRAQQHTRETEARVTRQTELIRTFERTGQAVLARIGRNLLRGMLRSLDAAREDFEHLKKLATGSLPAALVEHDVQ